MTWLDRQSFLGASSEQRLAEAVVGFAGLGGGNSHVVQQLAHVGIGNFVLADEDIVTITNLNRLVGATREDAEKQIAKTEVMKRMILAINPEANVNTYQCVWQLVPDPFKRCDLIVGGLDNVRSKDELDAFCRRFLIPYIDQGMDVHKIGDRDYLISGQVVLSAPGGPCLRCLDIVKQQALGDEARAYGEAGPKPQVVWPNGILASSAVGIAVSLLTPWHKGTSFSRYLTYDGNAGVMVEGERLKRWGAKTCAHYAERDTGDPSFDIRKVMIAAVGTEAAEPSAERAVAAPPPARSLTRVLLDLFLRRRRSGA